MPRKRVELHRGGWASASPRGGANRFNRESAQITRRLMWGARYETRNRWSSNAVIRNPDMKPLLHRGKKHHGR